MSTTLERVEDRTTTVDAILRELLAYEEVLGAVAVNSEGLVLGTAGLIETDVDLVSLMGASLVGVVERTSNRLGAGATIGFSIVTEEGMLSVRHGGTFAVMALSAHCDTITLLDVMREPMSRIGAIVKPE
jgi:predicted regulator of Ras-like GTPase activity (Roadblock/LC7/MglB family)